MRPIHKNILAKQLTREQLGKIVLPESIQDDWLRGKVIKLGPDIEQDIKIGDVVIFPPAPPHLGEYPTIGDEGYLIISENMVLAIED